MICGHARLGDGSNEAVSVVDKLERFASPASGKQNASVMRQFS
jgi:hypothetical protein